MYIPKLWRKGDLITSLKIRGFSCVYKDDVCVHVWMHVGGVCTCGCIPVEVRGWPGVFSTHTLYLLGQALLLHTKPEDSDNLAIQFAQEPFVSGWAEITGQPSHPNCFPELWGSELRSALLHSWYFIHQAACLASYVKTLPETMYSLSSRDLVGLCPEGDRRCSFHSGVSYSCVSSQCCQ